MLNIKKTQVFFKIKTITTNWAYQVPLNLFSIRLRFCLYSEDYLSVVRYMTKYRILTSYLFGRSVSIHFHYFWLTKLQTTVQSLTLSNFPNLYSKCVLVEYQVLSPLLSTKPLPAMHQKIGRRPTEGLYRCLTDIKLSDFLSHGYKSTKVLKRT